MNPGLLHGDLCNFLYSKLCVVCAALPVLVLRAVKGGGFLFCGVLFLILLRYEEETGILAVTI